VNLLLYGKQVSNHFVYHAWLWCRLFVNRPPNAFFIAPVMVYAVVFCVGRWSTFLPGNISGIEKPSGKMWFIASISLRLVGNPLHVGQRMKLSLYLSSTGSHLLSFAPFRVCHHRPVLDGIILPYPSAAIFPSTPSSCQGSVLHEGK